MKISGIYAIICKENGKYYIGSSKNIHSRVVEHIRLLRQGKHHCRYLQNIYNVYKEDLFVIICEECGDADLLKTEQKYLDEAKQYRGKQCVNSSFVAGRVEHTPEVREKISRANKGRPSKLRGRRRSKETLHRMSIAMKGRTLTEEHRQKVCKTLAPPFKCGQDNPMFGKHFTEEAKRKLSQANKGKNTGNKWNLGRKASEEARKNISEGLKKYQEGLRQSRLI